MILVATDKISRYLQEEPDARLSLLIFIKEFPYRQLFSGRQERSELGSTEVIAFPDLGVYAIKYLINADAGAFFITWVGKAELLRSHADTSEVKTTTIAIVPPAPFEGNRPKLPEIKTRLSRPNSFFNSRSDYENGLARVEQLFVAERGSAAFTELIELLPMVAAYEEQNLRFPTFTAAEIVRNRMNMFQLDVPYLSSVLNDKYDIQSFLNGSLILPDADLNRLYNLLGYMFPAADTRFIAG